MGRINLQVPFEEKDQARQLGARWDRAQKVWYVPDGTSAMPFERWRPVAPQPSIRAREYFLARSSRECWRCDAQTTVHAIVLPSGHERLYVADDPADDEWEVVEAPTTIFYISDMQEPVPTRLKALAPRFKPAYSQTARQSYWMNHCEHCEARLGDFFTSDESDAAFNPVTRFAASSIRLQLVRESFAANCGAYTEDMPLFGLMQRCE